MIRVSSQCLRIAAIRLGTKRVPQHLVRQMSTLNKNAPDKWDNKPKVVAPRNLTITWPSVSDALEDIAIGDARRIHFKGFLQKAEVSAIVTALGKRYRTLAVFGFSHRDPLGTYRCSENQLEMIQEKSQKLQQGRGPRSYEFLNVPMNETSMSILCQTIIDLADTHEVYILTTRPYYLKESNYVRSK